MVAKFQLNKMPITMDLKSGTRVRSQQFGLGTVEFDKGTTVIVRFDHALEECEKNSLSVVRSVSDCLAQGEWDLPLPVILKSLAASIVSVNDN
jgi:hypothetical protein